MSDARERQIEFETRREPLAALVAGGVLSSYRTTLLGRDLWGHVARAVSKLAQRDDTFVDHCCEEEWVDLSTYVLLLEALSQTVGTEALRTLVRRNIVDPVGASFYAPMMRSWARSFRAGPERMLRGAVHVWRSGFRNAGALTFVLVQDGHVQLALEGAVRDACLRSRAFATAAEGFALGCMDLAQPRPMFIEVEMVRQIAGPVLVCKWAG